MQLNVLKSKELVISCTKADKEFSGLMNYVRPVGCQVFHFALSSYMSKSPERIQKRVLSIIYPHSNYADRLEKCGIKTLSDRRVDVCENSTYLLTYLPIYPSIYFRIVIMDSTAP